MIKGTGSGRQTEVYITVLTNANYIRGVKALKRSLRNVKSKHDLVILVPKSKEKELRSITAGFFTAFPLRDRDGRKGGI